MGCTTEFEGEFMIEPPLSPAERAEINKFCSIRHEGVLKAPGDPSIWCDWETDGTQLFWNGSEKSYAMDAWVKILIRRFFEPDGHTLNGTVFAQGENPHDRWSLTIKDNKIFRGTYKFVEHELKEF